MIDRKGIFSYLLITFVITYLIEGSLILSGFRVGALLPPMYGQLTIAAVMWVPALAVVLTVKFVTKEGFGNTGLRFGSWRPYVKAALAIPLVFVIIYGLTWLTGLGKPDWQLTGFMNLMKSAAQGGQTIPPPKQVLGILLLSSLFLGPTINGIFGFGEELGWRGYLLPKLMPLGKAKAYVILGVIWGLWHAPLVAVGFNYTGHPVLGIVAMSALTTALGVYLNEMRLRYDSSVLAGSIHGAFNGQGYGIWRILFPDYNPLLGGVTGVMGIIILLLFGLWQVRVNKNQAV